MWRCVGRQELERREAELDERAKREEAAQAALPFAAHAEQRRQLATSEDKRVLVQGARTSVIKLPSEVCPLRSAVPDLPFHEFIR